MQGREAENICTESSFRIFLSPFPHLPGEGCQILSELFSSSASYPPAPPLPASLPPPRPPLPRPLLPCQPCHPFAKLFANVRTQCAPLDIAGPQPGTFPAQWAPLDLNLGPSQLSGHRWTSTSDLPSSVCTAGPQPGTCPAQCALLDLNLGPAQLSVHCWTLTAT